MDARVEIARPEHCELLAAHLRGYDREDLRLSSGLTPEEAVRYSLHASVAAWVWRLEDEVAAMFGLVARSLLGPVAVPWALTTPLVERHRLSFIRRVSPEIRARMLAHYPELEGLVDAHYHQSIRWLRHLGFTVHTEEPHAEGHLTMYRFTLRRT